MIVLADGTVVTANTDYYLPQLEGMKFRAAVNAAGRREVTGCLIEYGSDVSIAALSISVTAVNDAPRRISGTVNDLTVAEDSITTSLGLETLGYGSRSEERRVGKERRSRWSPDH